MKTSANCDLTHSPSSQSRSSALNRTEFQETRTMFPWRAAIAALSAAGALCLPAAVWAQNAIQSITSSQQAGTEVVRSGTTAHCHRPAGRYQRAGPQQR